MEKISINVGTVSQRNSNIDWISINLETINMAKSSTINTYTHTLKWTEIKK